MLLFVRECTMPYERVPNENVNRLSKTPIFEMVH